MSIIAYTLVQNYECRQFTQDVEKHLDLGWQPYGAMQTQYTTSGIIYIQCLVKYEEVTRHKENFNLKLVENKIPKYINFTDKRLILLDEKVNSTLTNGWQLVGGLVAFPNPDYTPQSLTKGMRGDREPTIFAQTMSKYE